MQKYIIFSHLNPSLPPSLPPSLGWEDVDVPDRFMKACGGKKKKAVAMHRIMLRWRKENGVGKEGGREGGREGGVGGWVRSGGKKKKEAVAMYRVMLRWRKENGVG